MGLMKYTIKRLGGLFPMLFGILILSFMLLRITPGNPYYLCDHIGAMMMSRSQAERYLMEYERLKLGKPVFIQFITYCTNCMGSFLAYLIFAYTGGLIIHSGVGGIMEIKCKLVKNAQCRLPLKRKY